MAREPAPRTLRRQQVGKYQILAHVATGGMGAVYRAMDTETGREVALKILPPEVAEDPAIIERFQREAQHGMHLRSEHVVEFIEYGEANGIHFLALEFVEGVDLQKYVTEKKKLDPNEARAIILQAAKALQHLHQRGIVHRDIKPSNFLISKRDGKLLVKLIDLGLARRASDEDFRVTRAGSTVGTVDYMAPEQARDSGKADIRSDLYSLGCTWYHLLAGQPPFAEGGLTERMYKHVETPPVDIRKHNGKVTKRTAQVLHQLLAKDPAERQQTPAELIRQLSQPEKDDAAVDANVLLHLALAEDETLESRSGILMRGGQGTHVRLREERATWFARWCDRFVEQLPWSAVKLTLTAAVLAGLVVLTLRLTRPGAPPPAPRGELKNFSTTRTSA